MIKRKRFSRTIGKLPKDFRVCDVVKQECYLMATTHGTMKVCGYYDIEIKESK